jgi:hypothetical protein
MLGSIGMSELLIMFVVALIVFGRRGWTTPPDGQRADARQVLKEQRPC